MSLLSYFKPKTARAATALTTGKTIGAKLSTAVSSENSSASANSLENNADENSSSAATKRKFEDPGNCNSSSGLTADQKETIEAKRQAALAKMKRRKRTKHNIHTQYTESPTSRMHTREGKNCPFNFFLF